MERRSIAAILAGIGAFLAAVGPLGHGTAGIIGVVLLFAGLIVLADAYGDVAMKNNAVWWFVFAFVAAIVLALAVGTAIASLIGGLLAGRFLWSALPLAVAGVVGLAAAWILFLLSAARFKAVMDSLADKTGEGLFRTAGQLYRWGAVLIIALVGIVLLVIAYVLAGVALLIVGTK
ncbi:MAG: DUF996 domain-containing protein [Thermoproteus sp.]|nr:DUF996 domain-containing protein [Thermoproteus sp.]